MDNSQHKSLLVISRILTIAGSAILALCIIVCLALVVPRLFGIKPYAVASGSMEPELPVGSVVYVQEVEPAALKEGDIITFSQGALGGSAQVVTHRVMENQVRQGELITKGDANEAMDPQPVPYLYVLGKVVLTVPVMGSLVAWLDPLSGKAAMVFIVVGALILCLVGDALRRKASSANTAL